jgi:hypothetical protein
MAIKHFSEIAFRIIRFMQSGTKSVLRMGDKLKSWEDITWLQVTKNPDVQVGYDTRGLKRYKELDFYVYFKGKCVGGISFHFNSNNEVPRQVRNLFKGRVVAVPHVAMAESFRGLGYPTMIYGLALKKKMVLASDHHSADAAGLWEAVARKYGAKIAYASEENRWQLSDTPIGEDDWKIMFR